MKLNQLENRRKKIVLWLGGILGVLAVLLLSGFGWQTAVSTQTHTNYPPPGNLIAVDCHTMHLYCIGEGSPTVVLESGLGETLLNWSKVQTETAVFTRTCSYDRAGFGWSEPVDDPVFSPQVADMLHTLLQNAGESAPYVLVGHSAGGIHVRNFAHQYPNDVAGIVLVDSSHDNQRAEDPAEGNNPLLTLCQAIAPFGIVRALNLAEEGADANPHLTAEQQNTLIALTNQTHFCHATANEETAADTDMRQPHLKPLGDLHLTVLTATQTVNQLADEMPPELIAQVNELWTAKQLELVALSTNSTQILATESAHYIQYDQPELVIEAIQQMVLLANASE
ncbi:MAG: alpha/beta hydrolase [Chloroflexi bacterium]|nr:MAG: alpha/beta hydrolase [Chloroflexota bacterium]